MVGGGGILFSYGFAGNDVVDDDVAVIGLIGVL